MNKDYKKEIRRIVMCFPTRGLEFLGIKKSNSFNTGYLEAPKNGNWDSLKIYVIAKNFIIKLIADSEKSDELNEFRQYRVDLLNAITSTKENDKWRCVYYYLLSKPEIRHAVEKMNQEETERLLKCISCAFDTPCLKGSITHKILFFDGVKNTFFANLN